MVAPPNSQVAPLPSDLPFRVISKTIGQGAYASIRKACPLNARAPVVAVKFIHKEHAFRQGKLKPKALGNEIALHKHLGAHPNIIRFLKSGDTPTWIWILMELADGGDLFDKIEADEGVGEDVAHFYFAQLISAVSYMHSKGVAHRDLKPENILVSADGDLKLADFGLATQYTRDGKMRLCTTVCGSPPYIAPEIVTKMSRRNDMHVVESGYMANLADIWSCGVILFVLLVGNTPWDEPTQNSWEFVEYVQTRGHTSDELWQKIPPDVLSLLRGMLKVEPRQRFTLENIRTHPWFMRRNQYLDPEGHSTNPIGLATRMLESLRIDFTADPITSSRRRPTSSDACMEIDSWTTALGSATQPETPMNDMVFDWERPARLATTEGISASQPVAYRSNASKHHYSNSQSALADRFAEDPAMSQFSQTPQVPISLTQQARQFRDIVPSHSLTRFYSPLSFGLLLPILGEALHRLGIPVQPFSEAELEGRNGEAFIRFKAIDSRKGQLYGTIAVERVDQETLEVRFLKARGDPLEWRRLFKKVVVLSRDAVLVPGS